MIRIKRGKEYKNKQRDYKVILNEKVIGKISHGQEKEFDAAPGVHDLYLKIDSACSNKITFEIDKEVVEFECNNDPLILHLLNNEALIDDVDERYEAAKTSKDISFWGLVAAFGLLYVSGWSVIWGQPLFSLDAFVIESNGFAIRFDDQYYGAGFSDRFFYSPFISWVCFCLALILPFGSHSR